MFVPTLKHKRLSAARRTRQICRIVLEKTSNRPPHREAQIADSHILDLRASHAFQKRRAHDLRDQNIISRDVAQLRESGAVLALKIKNRALPAFVRVREEGRHPHILPADVCELSSVGRIQHESTIEQKAFDIGEKDLREVAQAFGTDLEGGFLGGEQGLDDARTGVRADGQTFLSETAAHA